MKYLHLSAAALAVSIAAMPALAATTTVDSSSFADVNGTFGPITATTTTDANGRSTTVTGPGGGGNRYSNAGAPKDQWQQQNVGGGGTVGITKDYARNGNGSLIFGGTDGNSKADAEIYFSTPIKLADLTAATYDAYRDASSTAPDHLINSLRFIIGDATGLSSNVYLIYEPVYNAFPVASPVAENTWYSFNIDTSSIFFANNGNLIEPDGTGACAGCYASLGDWQAKNPLATIIGLSTGNGSGWNGLYRGAVDNIGYSANGVTTTFNFEVAAGAVPEPATWAMMIGGFGVVGGAMRRRRAVRTTLSFA